MHIRSTLRTSSRPFPARPIRRDFAAASSVPAVPCNSEQEIQMKEVPKQQTPDVSGGEYRDDTCIPNPKLPSPDDNYPTDPVGPVVLVPTSQ
jgi:hypothetical protein